MRIGNKEVAESKQQFPNASTVLSSLLLFFQLFFFFFGFLFRFGCVCVCMLAHNVKQRTSVHLYIMHASNFLHMLSDFIRTFHNVKLFGFRWHAKMSAILVWCNMELQNHADAMSVCYMPHIFIRMICTQYPSMGTYDDIKCKIYLYDTCSFWWREEVETEGGDKGKRSAQHTTHTRGKSIKHQRKNVSTKTNAASAQTQSNYVVSSKWYRMRYKARKRASGNEWNAYRTKWKKMNSYQANMMRKTFSPCLCDYVNRSVFLHFYSPPPPSLSLFVSFRFYTHAFSLTVSSWAWALN